MTIKPELFTPIHKALRLAMTETLARLGGTDFADAPLARAALVELRSVLVFCEKHLEHEERFVRPVAEARLPGGHVDAFDAHEAQAHTFAELRALADAVDAANDETRAVTGYALYLHFSRFVAENLAHMADEEQVLAPLLERFLTTEELFAIHARIQAAVTLEERAVSAVYLVRALSPAERRGLLAAMGGAR